MSTQVLGPLRLTLDSSKTPFSNCPVSFARFFPRPSIATPLPSSIPDPKTRLSFQSVFAYMEQAQTANPCPPRSHHHPKREQSHSSTAVPM